ncbi:kinase phosphorylation protein-domain-containing protein [Lanmaoa asiatica]|nr:kinase phosphorylation protein-domain-containing protein [Lanmaoa asiatica]
MFEPIRGGTRGGQAEFKWSDVSADKDREHYLGHSINAPTGRWQKNKDIHWYNRDKTASEAERQEEIRKVKEAEAEALSIALLIDGDEHCWQLLPQAPRMIQHVNKRKKRGAAGRLSVKRRNALAKKLAEQSMTHKTLRRVIETDHDHDLPHAEGAVTRETVAAGRRLVTARSAIIGQGTTMNLSGKRREKGIGGYGT